MKPVVDLKLDSGAYSAFTRQKVIDIAEYSDFILDNKDHLYSAVCLDVIDPKGPEVAAAAGWANLQYMQKRGIDAMPVFHARESTKWLDLMLKTTGYIGLSGTSLVSPSENLAWHHLMWSYLTDRAGAPCVKTHAFGDTSPYSMRTFPFFSADSATWQIASGKTGCVYIQGKPYQLRTKKIRNGNYLSIDDPKLKKDVWEKEICMRGIDVDMLMSADLRAVELTMIRCYLNCRHLMEVQATSAAAMTYDKSNSLMNLNCGLPGTPREDLVKMFYVISTAVAPWGLPVLTALGITDVLISYFYLEQKFWPELQAWCYDPVGECERNPRLKRYWDILQKFLLEPTTCKSAPLLVP